MICKKTCLVGLLICSILCGKNCTSATARVQFSSAKSNELADQQDMYFALITHLLSIRATTSWKMLMNMEFKADTWTGNPTRNSRCHTLASRALDMSCSFGQSERSLESRCVVKHWACDRIIFTVPHVNVSRREPVLIHETLGQVDCLALCHRRL